MDWGWVILIAMGILGAALLAGGIVLYRGGGSTGSRAAGAACVAAI